MVEWSLLLHYMRLKCGSVIWELRRSQSMLHSVTSSLTKRVKAKKGCLCRCVTIVTWPSRIRTRDLLRIPITGQHLLSTDGEFNTFYEWILASLLCKLLYGTSTA